MDIQQQNIQSFFFDDYTVFLMPASGFGGMMYLVKEDAYGHHETRRVAKEDVAYVLENESAPFAEALNVRFFQEPETPAKAHVEAFTKLGAAPFNEQVNEILFECEDMKVEPPYREILEWIKLTGKDNVPAPELIIPEEWDAYKGEMGLRNL